MNRNSPVLAALMMAALTFTAAYAGAAAVPSNIKAAVADTNRPDADRQRDADRKPAETLAFAGVKPGTTIAELLPGGGYFTRLFSDAVGNSGHVYLLVPPRPADAPAGRPDFVALANAVIADGKYPNVSVVVGPYTNLEIPAPVDMVWTSLNYHDLHNIPDFDVGAFNKRVFDGLKPGGIYLVLDHAAEAGSGTRDTKTLHRIDPQTVTQEVRAAGFVLVASSDLLRRTDDAHTLKVQDPSIRGKTDQFILKFRKPAK